MRLFHEAAVNFRFLISSAPHLEQEHDEGTLKSFISLNLSSHTSSTGISRTLLTEQQSQSLSWCNVTAEMKKLHVRKLNLIKKLFQYVPTHVDRIECQIYMSQNTEWCLERDWDSCRSRAAVFAFEWGQSWCFRREIQRGNSTATTAPFCIVHSNRHCIVC